MTQYQPKAKPPQLRVTVGLEHDLSWVFLRSRGGCQRCSAGCRQSKRAYMTEIGITPKPRFKSRYPKRAPWFDLETELVHRQLKQAQAGSKEESLRATRQGCCLGRNRCYRGLRRASLFHGPSAGNRKWR